MFSSFGLSDVGYWFLHLFTRPIWPWKYLKVGPVDINYFWRGYFGLPPHPVTVTTRIITFLVGDPYKPSFATVTGRGDKPRDTLLLHKTIAGWTWSHEVLFLLLQGSLPLRWNPTPMLSYGAFSHNSWMRTSSPPLIPRIHPTGHRPSCVVAHPILPRQRATLAWQVQSAGSSFKPKNAIRNVARRVTVDFFRIVFGVVLCGSIC